MGKRKTNQLSIRLEEEILQDLEKAAEATGMDQLEIVRTLLRTFVKQINAGDKLEFPLRLKNVPKSEAAAVGEGRQPIVHAGGRFSPSAAEQEAMLNEQPSGPRARSTRGIKKIIKHEESRS